ncbi:SIS domain-containing protein [Deinococcus frigens]
MFAGGSKAAVTAAEEAEDDMAQGASDARNLGVGPLDVLIGVSASGTTRYVIGALQAARQAGAYTITMINNRRGAFEALPHCVVVLDTGAEVITGSTRLKAGTAQKITLSIFSTAVMVGLGKAFGNLMVDVKPNNHKLRERSVWLIMAATGADEHTARTTLELAQGQLKAAIVMLRLQVSASAARQRLTAMNGQLRDALAHA